MPVSEASAESLLDLCCTFNVRHISDLPVCCLSVVNGVEHIKVNSVKDNFIKYAFSFFIKIFTSLLLHSKITISLVTPIFWLRSMLIPSAKKNVGEECYFVKKRTEELIRTKNPGEYLVFNEVAPLDSTDAFTFHISETYQRLPCQHNHASADCRCHMPLPSMPSAKMSLCIMLTPSSPRHGASTRYSHSEKKTKVM